MAKKQLKEVITVINAALCNGQPQPWMYESLGIAMQLDGRSKSDIERAIMSAADFATSADEPMYIAQIPFASRSRSRAMLVCRQVAKVEPLRSEAYAFGLRAAEQCNDVAGVRWATVGILSQAWPANMAEIEITASRVAKATLERLASEGRDAERDAFLKRTAGGRRPRLRGSRFVDRRSRRRCSGRRAVRHDLLDGEPRTVGRWRQSRRRLFRSKADRTKARSEVYVCPKGFAGTYRVRIRRVWGEVAAGKVTVDVYTHLRSGDMQHERKQLELSDKDAMVVFDLNQGRRAEPIEPAQLAGAVKRQE